MMRGAGVGLVFLAGGLIAACVAILNDADAQLTQIVPNSSSHARFSQISCTVIHSIDDLALGSPPHHKGFGCANNMNLTKGHTQSSLSPEDAEHLCPIAPGWEKTVKWMSFQLTSEMKDADEDCNLGIKEGVGEGSALVAGLEAWSSMSLGEDTAHTCDYSGPASDTDGWIDDVGDWCVVEDPVGTVMTESDESFYFQNEAVSGKTCDHISGGIACIREDWRYVGT